MLMKHQVNVALPLPNDFDETYTVHAFMRKEMLDRKAFSAHFKHNGQWWTRCSAQVFNEVSRSDRVIYHVAYFYS